MSKELIDLLGLLCSSRSKYALATVIEVIGSASAQTGARAVFDSSGKSLFGWVGGGCAHSMVVHEALDSLQDGLPRIIEIDLTDEVFGAGMPCGGHMRVFIEPVFPNPMLWLLGRGALVDYLCVLASDLGFDVIVDDVEADMVKHPSALRVISDDHRYEKLLPQKGDYVVIATHHKGDYLALHQALRSEADYIGVVASRKRSVLVMNRLRADGVSNTQINRVNAPAGMNIGSLTHKEIALSIVTEMVALRRQKPIRANSVTSDPTPVCN